MSTNGHPTPQPFAAVVEPSDKLREAVAKELGNKPLLERLGKRSRKRKSELKRFEVHYSGGPIMHFTARDAEAARFIMEGTVPKRIWGECELREAK